MEAAQTAQQDADAARPEQQPPAAPDASQPSATPLHVVPGPQEAGTEEPEVPEPPRRAAATQEEDEVPEPARAPRGGKREDRPETATAKDGDTGPSRDQVRRYRERWNKARTAEEKAEALRYGAERGIPEAAELLRMLSGSQGTEAAPKSPAAQPQPAPAASTAAPPPGAAPAGAPTPPAEPMVQGLPRKAVAAHVNKAVFLANMLEGFAKLAGWEAPPAEPMTVFEDVPGVEPITATGNVKKEFVELLSVELATGSARAGGEAEGPWARRMKIGLVVLTMTGPGLLPLGARMAGGAMGKLKQVSRALATNVRRFRR